MSGRDLIIVVAGALLGVVSGYVILGGLDAITGAICGGAGGGLLSLIDKCIRKLRGDKGTP